MILIPLYLVILVVFVLLFVSFAGSCIVSGVVLGLLYDDFKWFTGLEVLGISLLLICGKVLSLW